MSELAHYSAARHALSAAASYDEVKDIRDKSAAMIAYARQAADRDMLRWATEIKVRAERKAGEMLAEAKATGGRHSGSGDQKSESRRAIPIPTLADIGISASQSSRWQKLAAVPETQFEQAVAAALEIAGEVNLGTVMAGGTLATLHTGDEESYTPEIYIEAARTVLGGIALDPASNDMAQQTVRADKYFTVEDDGLSKHWAGTVWMNPPYTALVINKFMDKLIAAHQSGEVPAAIALTNNNTDTSWWHKSARVATAICFTAGRINFIKRDGSKSSPTNGQNFFYFGDKPEQFASVFSRFGHVMVNA